MFKAFKAAADKVKSIATDTDADGEPVLPDTAVIEEPNGTPPSWREQWAFAVGENSTGSICISNRRQKAGP